LSALIRISRFNCSAPFYGCGTETGPSRARFRTCDGAASSRCKFAKCQTDVAITAAPTRTKEHFLGNHGTVLVQ